MSLVPAMDVFMLQENIKTSKTCDRPKSLAMEQVVIAREDICPGFCGAASAHCCFWLGFFVLCFPFVLLNGSARHTQPQKKRASTPGIGGSWSPSSPSSYCSTFHSDDLFIDCMTKTCNLIKYRWEDSLDNEIPYQTLAAKLCEIAPCNS